MNMNYSLSPSSFLSGYLHSLKDELKTLNDTLSECQLRHRETIKLIAAIEQSTDKQYASFTPFDVNHDNELKVKDLKEQVHLLSSRIDDLTILIRKKELIISDFEECILKVNELEQNS